MGPEQLIPTLLANVAFQYAGAVLVGVPLATWLRRHASPALKQVAIISSSGLLIAWLDLWSFVLLTVLSGAVFALVRTAVPIRKIVYPLFLVLLGALIAIKDYWVFTGETNPYIPLGVSYYFFRLIAFLIEYSKAPDKVSRTTALDYFTWVFFFPVFLAGPILRFKNMGTLSTAEYDARWAGNVLRLVGALCAKLVIVDAALRPFVYESLAQHAIAGTQGPPPLVAMGFGFFALLHAYLDLMLYTELSKAVAGLFGYTNQENFNRPLLATNISQFWQRWHMSLSDWTRDYVFFPVLVKRKNTWLATYASMLTIGVWHSANANWIVWAVLHATHLNIYGSVRKTSAFARLRSVGALARVMPVLGNVFTIWFVSVVFIFVALHDFEQAVSVFFKVFGG